MVQNNTTTESKLIYAHNKSKDTFLYKGFIFFALVLMGTALFLVFKFGTLSDAVPVIIGCTIMLALITSFCWEYLTNTSNIKIFEDHIELEGQTYDWSTVSNVEQTLLVHFIRITFNNDANDLPKKLIITNRFTNRELFILPHHTKLAEFLIEVWSDKSKTS